MEWTDEQTLKFIDLCKCEPVIWNTKNANGSDSKSVHLSWRRLKGVMGMPVSELKKKKNALLEEFLEHSKRKHEAVMAGDFAYNDPWPYADAMEEFFRELFIDPTAVPNETINESDDDSENPYEPTAKRKKRDAMSLADINKEMSNAFLVLNNLINERANNHKDDEFDLYGKLMAVRLRQLPKADSLELMQVIDGLVYRKKLSVNEESSSESASVNEESPPAPVESPSEYLQTAAPVETDLMTKVDTEVDNVANDDDIVSIDSDSEVKQELLEIHTMEDSINSMILQAKARNNTRHDD